MSFLPDLLTKLKKPGAALAAFFRGLPGKARAPGKPSADPARGKGVLSGKLPPERRKRLFMALGAALVLLLLSLAAALLITSRRTRAGPPPKDPAGPVQGGILREELFLPEEPDFVPGVLLERERRNFWTPEDAAPYWQDPLKHGEEPWREQAESVIDELLERVP